MDPLELEELRKDIIFRETIRGITLTFHTTWGLFSPKGIDPGARLLIEHLEVGEEDVCLDLNCNYGEIGLFMSRMAPRGQVYLCDRDFIAVRYARLNAHVNRRKNCEALLSNGFSDVPPQIVFDVIACYPPSRVNKELLLIWMHDALNRLRDGGRFYIVTRAHIRKFIKRNLKEIFGNYERVRQTKTHAVSLAVRDDQLLERLRWGESE